MTLAEAAERWLALARSGTLRNRSGQPYKPSTLRGYDQLLRERLLPRFGALDLGELRRAHLQRLVSDLLAEGFDASTVRNTIVPLRAIYRDVEHFAGDGDRLTSPTAGLRLPASAGKRERLASPGEASELIAALEPRDRALWATALYAGLRRGELRALRVDDVDFAREVINVRRSWDPVEGPVSPKSQSGVRSVPLPALLRDHLLNHINGLARGGPSLVFGRAEGLAFDPSTVADRAHRAWRRIGREPIGLHDCRHSYASLMIAAGVNAKALSVFMGHASITITLDRYGHLFPGSEAEAAALLDSFLKR